MESQQDERVLRYNQSVMKQRNTDELIGLCKGVIADKKVCQLEATFLLQWLQANPNIFEEFPANLFYSRLAEMLEDGNLDDEEAQELLLILQDITGEKGQQGVGACTIDGIYDDPMPDLVFFDRTFCLTGTFVCSKRKDVQRQIEERGGRVVKNITMTGCILVVGPIASETWVHSTYGRKIKLALEAKEKGKPIYIVTEEHVVMALEGTAENNVIDSAEVTHRTNARQSFRNLMQHDGKAEAPKPPKNSPARLESLQEIWSGNLTIAFSTGSLMKDRVYDFYLSKAYQDVEGALYLGGSCAQLGGDVLQPFKKITSKIYIEGEERGCMQKRFLRDILKVSL